MAKFLAQVEIELEVEVEIHLMTTLVMFFKISISQGKTPC